MKLQIKDKAKFLAISMLTIGILSCSRSLETVETPSEVGNPTNVSIVGFVLNEQGVSFNESVSLKIRPSNFVMEPEELGLRKQSVSSRQQGATRQDILSESSGDYQFTKVTPGKYVIEINFENTFGAIVEVEVSGLVDTVRMDTTKLRPTGKLTGVVTFDSTFDASLLVNSYVQVVGVDRLVKPDTNTGEFEFPSLPEGDYTVKLINTNPEINDNLLINIEVVSTVETIIDSVKLEQVDTTFEVTLIPNGLTHYWKFDEAQGDTLHDMVSGLNGVILGGPTWTTGRKGGALLFDGVDDEVKINRTVIDSDFTVSSWVYLTGMVSNHDVIIGEKNDGTNLNFANRMFRFYCGCSVESWRDIVIAKTPTQTNMWVHTAIVKIDTVFYLYLNGVLEVKGQWDGTFEAEYIGSGNGNGGPPIVNNDAYLEGKIDELRIYNRGLNPAEIQTLAREAMVNIEVADGLVHYWTLDKIVDSSVLDEVGLQNGKVFGNFEIIKGKRDNSFQFNGLNSYVGLPVQELKGDYSVTSWIQHKGVVDNKDVIIGREHPMPNLNFHDSTFRFFVGSNKGADVLISNSFFTIDRWYHIAVVKQGNQLTLYIDGTMDAVSTWDGLFSYDAIGKGAQGILDGLLDDVRIYDRGLTSEEILILAN